MDKNDQSVWAVSQLNQEIAHSLADTFSMIWIEGEISNLVIASSGHWYFSLKDDSSLIKAVMFRSRSQMVGKPPKVGDTVQVYAKPTIYQPRGEIQLQVDRLRSAGLGQLYEQFLQRKQQLEAQGVFAAERKLPIPSFVQTVGIITSLQAAALQDVLATLARRTPHIRIIIYPCLVQGAEAPASILEAFHLAQRRKEVDVILLVRGGGSLEDLWCYNDYDLVLGLSQTTIPIIAGVGHETDTTLVDFVASYRAPTPTAAAEYVSVETAGLHHHLRVQMKQLRTALMMRLRQMQQMIDYQERLLIAPADQITYQQRALEHAWLRLQQKVQHELVKKQHQLHSPIGRWGMEQQVKYRQQQLQSIYVRLVSGLRQHMGWQKQRLAFATQQLETLSPHKVLARGYAIVQNAQQKVTYRIADVQPGEHLQIQLADGRMQVEVLSTLPRRQ